MLCFGSRFALLDNQFALLFTIIYMHKNTFNELIYKQFEILIKILNAFIN